MYIYIYIYICMYVYACMHAYMHTCDMRTGCPHHFALVVSIAYFRARYRIPNSERQPRASALARILKDPLLAGTYAYTCARILVCVCAHQAP